MTASLFVRELDELKNGLLAPLVAAGRTSLMHASSADAKRLLQIALANEISVSELAAAWMPSTWEMDVKIALARQAGDEASHFELVADRLMAMGFDLAAFRPPGAHPLFDYLRGLTTTVERVAAGLFALESIAYAVNENFIAFCERRGDTDTVRIYHEFIQPDERTHQHLGRQLLVKYATTPDLQRSAREAVVTVLELAAAARVHESDRVGTACFPGC